MLENSGILKLYSGFEFDNVLQDQLIIGTTYSAGSSFELKFEGVRELKTSENNATKFQLSGNLNW